MYSAANKKVRSEPTITTTWWTLPRDVSDQEGILCTVEPGLDTSILKIRIA